jgi:chromosome segregation ATPase
MQLDAATVTAIGGLVTMATASLGAGVKVLADKIATRFEKIETKLDECNKKHTEDRELIGGLNAQVQALIREQERAIEQQDNNTTAIDELRKDTHGGS